jgi:dATP pyrophosphohydrolase
MNLRHDLVDLYVVRPDESGGSHEFLQLRRRPNSYLGGTWQTLHGKIEPGESAVETALRELREETSLVPLEFYQLDTINLFYMAANDSIWLCPGFCAVIERAARIVLNEEHDDLRWIARSQVDRFFMWPGSNASSWRSSGL